jgi:beta-galactosidase
VLGPRAGLKDEYNALLSQRQPGYLANVLGAQVEQFYALEKNVAVNGALGSGEATIWAEQLRTTDANTQVLLRYGASNGWLDGQAAVVSRAVGKGSITYVGAVFDSQLVAAIAEHIARDSGVKPVFGTVPEGVEVNRRIGPGKEIFVFVNFSQQPRMITLPHPMKSLLENKQTESFELPQYAVGLALDQR